MNPNEIPPNANPRLSRIKKLSHCLKLLFLLYAGLLGLLLLFGEVKTPIRIGEQSFNSLQEIPMGLKIYEAIRGATYLLGAIAIYRLLNLYEKGIIFSAENVLYIRRLGKLAVFFSVLTTCRTFFETLQIRIAIPILPLNILTSPWFVVGCLTIVIAWVMDEGRKIQEEQTLTV